MVDDKSSPIAKWLRATFPNHRGIQTRIRVEAGAAKLIPPSGAAFGTQGGAIDWWIRFLAAPNDPDLHLAIHGLPTLQGHPACNIAIELFQRLGVEFDKSQVIQRKQNWTFFDEFDDEAQARICYVLALLTEFFRAPIIRSKLLTLEATSTIADLLNLASKDEVRDLIAMRDAVQRKLASHWNTGTVICGPTFEGSRDLNADADLILGDLLLEIKATQGGKPRADGTRAIRVERTDIDQLLGYLLMDYSDSYTLRRVGFYAVRFDSLNIWTIDDFLNELAGRETDIAEARNGFKNVLQQELPRYLQR